RSSKCTTAAPRRHRRAADRPRPRHPRRLLPNPEPPRAHVARSMGLVVSPPAPLARWVERHGGDVDVEARSFWVARVAPLEAARAGDLCPFTLPRHRELAVRASAEEGVALLVDAPLAAIAPPGRRWVHPHAGWALAGILADLAPATDEPRREGAI